MNAVTSGATTADADVARRYRERVADAILARRVEIADDWLQRLVDVVGEAREDIFPTSSWLDHVPVLIGEIAEIVRSGDETLVLRNSVVAVKAVELGELRHRQRASVHQLLREYDLLAAVLERVAREATLGWDQAASLRPVDCLKLAATLARVVRSIMQSTVDTFVERYAATLGEQSERLRSLNGFVAHELRTPLQSASLNMEMVLATRASGDADRAELERVQGAIERIAELLADVETLVQPEARRPDDAVHQRVELAAAVRDAGRRQADGFAERGVALHVEKDLGTIVVDAGRLDIVLSNLLGNAIKYCDPDKDERHVHVRAVRAETDESVAIVLRDNGLGIPPSRRDEVFALRARAHVGLDATHGVSGHGFGLFLVAEALREMGGDIALDSEVGRWTEFTVTLPRIARVSGDVAVDREARDALVSAAELAPGTARCGGAGAAEAEER